jgi:Zn-dependent protease
MEETNCQYCDVDVIIPFECHFCRGHFCVKHRLPENHACPEYWKTTLPRARLPERSFPSATHRKAEMFWFSQTELRHIAVSLLLVMGVGLSFSWQFPNYLFSGLEMDVSLILAVVFASIFVLHEVAHKLVAQHYGLWAEFRLTLFGAILTLFSIISPLKIISPGAVMISGSMSQKTVGKTAIAGPLTNLVLSAIFLPFITSTQSLLSYVASIEVAINAWVALFNLIPFGIMDGSKILRWNKMVWFMAFAASVGLTIFSISYVF